MPLNTIKTPVVIVGAGPAGAAASFFLTKHGIYHVVIEKAVFPRDKVCGDACSGSTVAVIKMANPDWLSEIRGNTQEFLPNWGMTVVAPNGRSLDIAYAMRQPGNNEAKGFTVPRLVLDQFLFSKMNSPFCTIYQGANISAMQRAGQGVMLQFTCAGGEYELTTPIVIGADGDKSLVRKQFMPAETEAKTYAIGLRAYYEGVTGMHPDNHIELHFLPEMPSGYLWIFPLTGGHANVGVGMLSKTVRDQKINLRELMLSAIANNPRISGRFKNATLLGKVQGWGIPIFMKRQPFSGDNFMLAGDSALMVDPFSGEGIGNALYSGMLAADAVRQGIAANNYSESFFRDTYEAAFYQHLGPELQQNLTLQKIFSHQWLFNAVFSKAYKSPSLKKAICQMFTDADQQKQLTRLSFYLKVLFNK